MALCNVSQSLKIKPLIFALVQKSMSNVNALLTNDIIFAHLLPQLFVTHVQR